SPGFFESKSVFDARFKFFLIVFPLFTGIYLLVIISSDKKHIRLEFFGGECSLKNGDWHALLIQKNGCRNCIYIHKFCKFMHRIPLFTINESRVCERSSEKGNAFFTFCIKFYSIIIFLKVLCDYRMVKSLLFHCFTRSAPVRVKIDKNFFWRVFLRFNG